MGLEVNGTGSAGLAAIAGTVAFIGNFKLDKGYPKAGARIIAATFVLVILFSFVDNTPLAKPARALAWLMVLAAAIRYIPVLSNSKGK